MNRFAKSLVILWDVTESISHLVSYCGELETQFAVVSANVTLRQCLQCGPVGHKFDIWAKIYVAHWATRVVTPFFVTRAIIT